MRIVFSPLTAAALVVVWNGGSWALWLSPDPPASIHFCQRSRVPWDPIRQAEKMLAWPNMMTFAGKSGCSPLGSPQLSGLPV